MNIRKFLVFAFLCILWTQVIIAQDATAEFVTTNKEITITPEFPGFCSKEKGVTVTVNEAFESVSWIHPTNPKIHTSPRPLEGKTVILKTAGEWTILAQFQKNGVTCTVEKKFLVADLSDPNQIQKYFENAGFYSFSLWRDEDPPTIRQDDNSNKRSIECKLEEVRFEPSGNTILLKNQLQITLATFEPVQALGGVAKVTNNQCLCLGEEVLEFNVATGIWAHQFFKNNGDKEGLLFLKGKLPSENSLPLTEPDNNQKEYLEKNHTKYISNNVGADQQADVLAKNLLMCRRVGGFLDLPESSVPCGTFSEAAGYRYVFTTAGVPVLLPSGSFNYYFPEKLLSGAFPGALAKFQLGSSLYISHFNNNNEFKGFYYDTKATLYKNFQNPSNLNDFPFMIPTYWEKTSGDGCDVPVVLGNDLSLKSNIKATSDGGIGQSIKTSFNDVGTFDLLNYQTEMISVCPEPLNNNAGYADYWLSKTLLASTNYYCLYEIDGRFIAAFSNDHGQDFYYKEFINGCWIPVDVSLPYEPSLSEWLQLVSEATHVALDVVGAIPVFGTPADLTQATFYALEGDTYSSGLAMVAVIPFGEIAKYGDEFVMTSKQILNNSSKGPKGVIKTLYILYKFGGKPKIFDVRKVLKKLKETRPGITDDEFKVIGTQLINDLKTNFDFFDAIGTNVELIKAWEKLINTGLRTNIKWLETTSKWIDDGLELTSSATKVTIKKAGVEVGEISGDLLKVKYTGMGGDIVTHPTKTTSAIGKYQPTSGGPGTKNLIESGLTKSGENAGGVNVLNDLTNTNGWPDQQIWDQINKPWLDAAASRGDVIRAVSDPLSAANIYKNGVSGDLSFFGREHEHLTQILGYNYNPSTFTYIK